MSRLVRRYRIDLSQVQLEHVISTLDAFGDVEVADVFRAARREPRMTREPEPEGSRLLQLVAAKGSGLRQLVHAVVGGVALCGVAPEPGRSAWIATDARGPNCGRCVQARKPR